MSEVVILIIKNRFWFKSRWFHFMSELILFSEELKGKPKYIDRKAGLTAEELEKLESKSSTIYLGGLPHIIHEAGLYSIFSECGPIKRIIMGINSKNREPAGFWFIEFYEREAALAAIKWVNGTRIFGQQVVVNIDRGFSEGRQHGRGMNGFQKAENRKARPPQQHGRGGGGRGGGRGRGGHRGPR